MSAPLAAPGAGVIVGLGLPSSPRNDGAGVPDSLWTSELRPPDTSSGACRSEGAWSEVVSAYRTAADTIYDFYEDRYEETEAACRDIVKTVEHPDVKAAVERLRGKAGSTSEQLENDVKRWIEKARATYRLDCDSMTQMWEAYCGEDHEPTPDEAEGVKRATATAASLRTSMKAAMTPLLAELPTLEQRVDALVAKKETKARGEQFRRNLEQERVRLAKLSQNKEWEGNSEPTLFFANEYGKQRHKDLWNSFSCDVPVAQDRDAKFPGSEKHRKPDCINADECEIWEFKPNSPSGRSDGPTQRDQYAIVVPRYYTEVYRKIVKIEEQFGGAAIMQTLESKCLNKNEEMIELDAEVYYYDVCKKQYECVRAD
jgi:hypothetical protein